MVSPENTNWLSDYPLIDSDGVFSHHNPTSTYPWQHQLDGSATLSVEVDGFLCDSDVVKEPGSRKRIKSDGSSSKAYREKQRRDRLNEKFVELSSVMEPGRVAKTDKVAIINDTIRMVKQVREDVQKLKDFNSSLHEKIKELKDEKNELRDEKQKLKIDKERLEQQRKAIKTQPQPCFLPNPPTTLSQAQAQAQKLVPFTTYPGFAMWQFMPPASLDTSQDHVLRPPVA